MTISKDVQLLYSCISGRVESAEIATINWPDFLRLAERHKVQSLLYKSLKEYRASIPASVFSQIKSIMLINSLRAVQQLSLLQELNSVLATERIEFILLKGLSFTTLYKGLGERHVGDLDILVENESVLWQTVSVLQEKFSMVVSDSVERLTTRQQKEYCKYLKDVVLFYPAMNMTVEIHSRLFESRDVWGLKTKDIWRRKVARDIEGVLFNVLGQEDNLRYILIHGARCCWFRLKWFFDIELLVQDTNHNYKLSLSSDNSPANLKRVLPLLSQLQFEIQPISSRPVISTDYSAGMLIKLMAKVVAYEIDCFDVGARNKQFNGFSAAWRNIRKILYRAFLVPGLAPKKAELSRFFYSYDEYDILSLPDYLFFLYAPLRPCFLMLRMIGLPKKREI